MSSTRNLSNLPIAPFGKINVDLPLHFVPSAVAMRKVLHEGCGDGAEGATSPRALCASALGPTPA